MNGVFFEKVVERPEGQVTAENQVDLNDSGKIVMVATDGRRLAYINKDISGIDGDFSGVIIHTKILNIVVKHIADEGNVSIGVTEKNIFIKFGSYHLSSMLLEGQFPNYRRVIPSGHTKFFRVNRRDMLDAVKRVAQLVEKKSNRLYLNLSSGKITLSSEEGEIGYATEEVPCVYDGEDAKIPVSYIYLDEPLKAITQDEITVTFEETNRAITVKPEPEQDFFHIIMPMQGD
jgi:DNA polymerase-3 subunit beta